MSTNRKTYSREFKREAVELAATSGKSVKELERDLGLGEGTLRLWVRKAREDGADAFPGHGKLKPADNAAAAVDAARPKLPRGAVPRNRRVLGSDLSAGDR